MPSKKVWIAGAIVVAIGVVVYLSYNSSPAGKDAAGTIVEAKRARADGTNSANPAPTASTTDQSAADSAKGQASTDAAKGADAAAAAGSADEARNLDAKRKAIEASDAAGAVGGRGPRGIDARGLAGAPPQKGLAGQAAVEATSGQEK